MGLVYHVPREGRDIGGVLAVEVGEFLVIRSLLGEMRD